MELHTKEKGEGGDRGKLGEKVVSPSYSSAILGPPLLLSNINIHDVAKNLGVIS